MTAAEHPSDESARLEALARYGILDTEPEEAFDRYSALAARLFDVPIASVSFVDENRQWFKSRIGLEAPETSREISFCAHAILTDAVFVINDAARDERFRDNPSVTGPPYIRFYAGAPLQTPEGQNIGTLCIIDRVPREFSSEQQASLAELAKGVVAELELRRTADELRESQAFLEQALQEANQFAVAVRNVTSGVLITNPALPDNPIVFANPAFCSITGYEFQELVGRNCRFLQGPESDPAVVAQIHEAIRTRQPFRGLLLNYRKDGSPFINELSIDPVFDPDGNLLSFVGLQNDVTRRVQAEQAMREAQAALRNVNEQLEQRVEERTHELAQSQLEVLARLARAGEFRDDDTGHHTQRVARTCALLASALGLADHEILLIQQAAPLHDLGKIAIPDAILLKPGKLTQEEFLVMKSHAAFGAALLSGGTSDVVRMAERIAASHHERWDGNGYPYGIAGVDIPIEARIVSVADVFDALTHERPYKKAWSVADAVAEIERSANTAFDPQVVRVFLTLPHHELTTAAAPA